MMPARALRAYHDNGDRLVISLLIAAALHALLILGVAFAPEPEPAADTPPALDITLVPERKTAAPEKADYLAQVTQDGGGNTTEHVPAQIEQRASSVATPPPPPPAAAQPRELTRADARRKVQVVEEPRDRRDNASVPVSAAELINRSLELASVDQQLRQSLQAYSERPRQAFISARTQEFKYASYMNDWVAKVERVGNLNYPDAARRQGISGNLMLQVAINTDGSVRSIRLLRSSGHKVLDDAAVRIVQLAAPYPPLPQDIRKDTDILHITRTWEFINNRGLTTRR